MSVLRVTEPGHYLPFASLAHNWRETLPPGWYGRTKAGGRSFHGGTWHALYGIDRFGRYAPTCNFRWSWDEDEIDIAWIPAWVEGWELDSRWTSETPTFPRGKKWATGRGCSRCRSQYRQKWSDTMAATKNVKVRVEIETATGKRVYTGRVKQISQRREAVSWVPEDDEDLPDIGRPLVELVFVMDRQSASKSPVSMVVTEED